MRVLPETLHRPAVRINRKGVAVIQGERLILQGLDINHPQGIELTYPDGTSEVLPVTRLSVRKLLVEGDLNL